MPLTKIGLQQVGIICDSLRTLKRMATSKEITGVCMRHHNFHAAYSCKDPGERIRTLLQRESKEAKQSFRGANEIFIYDNVNKLWGLREIAEQCLDVQNAELFLGVQDEANRCDGHIYVNTNPAWPYCAKLGKSDDADRRLKAYQTYSPHRDWICVYYAYVKNQHYIERRLKKEILPRYRDNEFVNGKSIVGEEWFLHKPAAMDEIIAFIKQNKDVEENGD